MCKFLYTYTNLKNSPLSIKLDIETGKEKVYSLVREKRHITECFESLIQYIIQWDPENLSRLCQIRRHTFLDVYS